jgi:hypothetical protein
MVVIVSTCAMCLTNEGIICHELNGSTLNISMEHLSTRAVENFLHLYTRLQGGRVYTL